MGEFPEFFGAVFNQTIERVGIVLTILPFVEKIPAVVGAGVNRSHFRRLGRSQ
jgi:hypothetical protein